MKPVADSITCPGCNKETDTVGMLGSWVDGAGRFRGAYALCPECAATLQRGSKAERSDLTERIEHAMMLAEQPPTQGVN